MSYDGAVAKLTFQLSLGGAHIAGIDTGYDKGGKSHTQILEERIKAAVREKKREKRKREA